MKRIIRILSTACLALLLSVSGFYAVPASEAAAENTQTTADPFMTKLTGEYVPLFEGATFDAKYYHYWHDFSGAVLGDSMADPAVEMLKASIGGTEYGETASGGFFCGFANDVTKVTFGGTDGTQVTYTKKDNSTETYQYEFVGEANAAGSTDSGETMEMTGRLYKTASADAGDFTYLFMCPDTPDTTYHLEFRWGDTEENILQLTSGKYRNWLAAGINSDALSDPTEQQIKQVIGLFIVENVGSMASDETVSQRTPIIGRWDMDTTAFKNIPGYENASMYMELQGNGTGKSYVDMSGTGDYTLASEYTFYLYDTGKDDGKEEGVYLLSSDEGINAATYEITEDNGKAVINFVSSEGPLTYSYREAIVPAATKLSKLKAGGGKKLKIEWESVAEADGYEIQLSTSKKFKKATSVTAGSDQTSETVQKLKKKKYYVRVRAYTTDRTGEKVYGEYSGVKKANVR